MNRWLLWSAASLSGKGSTPVKQDVISASVALSIRRSPDYRGSWDQNRSARFAHVRSPASVFADADTGRLIAYAVRVRFRRRRHDIDRRETGAWIVTDSVALLSTLIDLILDAAASLVSLLAVRSGGARHARQARTPLLPWRRRPLAGRRRGLYFRFRDFLSSRPGSRFATPPVPQYRAGHWSRRRRRGLVDCHDGGACAVSGPCGPAHEIGGHFRRTVFITAADLLVNGSRLSILLAARTAVGVTPSAFAALSAPAIACPRAIESLRR